MRCFHAHIPSHSLTHSHMTIPSVKIVNGNTNDTHIPSLCRLTNTQCKSPMGNRSRVNPDSYHPTLGLSDKHNHVFSFGQQNLSAYTAGLLHLYRNFGSCRGSLTPMFQAFHLRGLMAPFLLRPTHINFFSFYDLNYESLLDIVPKKNSTHIHQEW